MALLIAKDIGRSWGDRVILRSCDLTVDPGSRIGLVGHNGCGKSTLLSILGGAVEPDHGEVLRHGSVALLAQEPVLDGETVEDAVQAAVGWHRELMAAYERALAEGRADEAARLQDALDVRGWEVDHRVDAV